MYAEGHDVGLGIMFSSPIAVTRKITVYTQILYHDRGETAYFLYDRSFVYVVLLQSNFNDLFLTVQKIKPLMLFQTPILTGQTCSRTLNETSNSFQ